MVTTKLCGDCQLMPGDRCTHADGRRAATPTTPAAGCAYFRAKGAPVVPRIVDRWPGGFSIACPRCGMTHAVSNGAYYCALAGKQVTL